MKLRVKAGARKGHWVGGVLIQPGEDLPGEFSGIPAGMEYKLEQVPDQPSATKSSAQKPAGKPAGQAAGAADTGDGDDGDDGGWYRALADKLKKDPSKDDLYDYAAEKFGETVEPSKMSKEDMVARINELHEAKAKAKA